LIPADAVLDPNSDAMVAYVARKNAGYALLYEFGIPIWEAASTTPSSPITCTMAPAWGPCPFTDGAPIPDGAYPHSGSDGAMVVVDRTANRSYEFWQFRREAAGYVTSWGAMFALDGAGWGGVGSSTAAGASRLGGVVRTFEIEVGEILHALVMSIDNACATGFRPPAVKTDGDSQRADCIPQGVRLQLDPTIDLQQIPGITRGEQIVARALQVFGVYVIDKGGGTMGISFELARDATSANNPGAVYLASGFAWDYFDMPHIPWSRLRVLRQWDGL
jgi:hypothetical protein